MNCPDFINDFSNRYQAMRKPHDHMGVVFSVLLAGICGVLLLAIGAVLVDYQIHVAAREHVGFWHSFYYQTVPDIITDKIIPCLGLGFLGFSFTAFFLQKSVTKHYEAAVTQNRYSQHELSSFIDKMKSYLLKDFPVGSKTIEPSVLVDWMKCPTDLALTYTLCRRISDCIEVNSSADSLGESEREILQKLSAPNHKKNEQLMHGLRALQIQK